MGKVLYKLQRLLEPRQIKRNAVDTAQQPGNTVLIGAVPSYTPGPQRPVQAAGNGDMKVKKLIKKLKPIFDALEEDMKEVLPEAYKFHKKIMNAMPKNVRNFVNALFHTAELLEDGTTIAHVDGENVFKSWSLCAIFNAFVDPTVKMGRNGKSKKINPKWRVIGGGQVRSETRNSGNS